MKNFLLPQLTITRCLTWVTWADIPHLTHVEHQHFVVVLWRMVPFMTYKWVTHTVQGQRPRFRELKNYFFKPKWSWCHQMSFLGTQNIIKQQGQGIRPQGLWVRIGFCFAAWASGLRLQSQTMRPKFLCYGQCLTSLQCRSVILHFSSTSAFPRFNFLMHNNNRHQILCRVMRMTGTITTFSLSISSCYKQSKISDTRLYTY